MEFDKEDLKNETKETVSQVKDTIKNVDINKEAKETKGFLKEMLVAPFEKVENIASGEEEAFKRAVILLLVHVVFATIVSILGYHSGGIFSKLWDLITDAITPIVSIIVPAIMILVMNKTNKKPLTTVVSGLVIAEIPSILASFISIIAKLLKNVYLITSPISTALYAATTILTFFAMKKMFDEDVEKFFGKYLIIRVITALAVYVI